MIDHLDHLVLTTAHETTCVDFYTRIMGMTLESFVGGTPPVTRNIDLRKYLRTLVHVKGKEFDPKAHLPVPGSLDLCFIASVPLEQVIAKLNAEGWPVIEGPVLRTGATQKIRSIYVRDPDLNLIEIAELTEHQSA